MRNILLVLSAADTWTRAGGSKSECGVWAEEFVIMHRRFLETGNNTVLATPGGVRPTFDPHSLSAEATAMDVAELKDHLHTFANSLATPRALHALDREAFDLIAIPGGYGALEDLHQDRALGRILERAWARDTLIAAVSHGPAALLSARDDGQRSLFAGRRMTAFSDEEAGELGAVHHGPWLLASRLREHGVLYERGPKWKPYVVRDRNLFTGQNPASTHALVDAVAAALIATAPHTDSINGYAGHPSS